MNIKRQLKHNQIFFNSVRSAKIIIGHPKYFLLWYPIVLLYNQLEQCVGIITVYFVLEKARMSFEVIFNYVKKVNFGPEGAGNFNSYWYWCPSFHTVVILSWFLTARLVSFHVLALGNIFFVVSELSKWTSLLATAGPIVTKVPMVTKFQWQLKFHWQIDSNGNKSSIGN